MLTRRAVTIAGAAMALHASARAQLFAVRRNMPIMPIPADAVRTSIGINVKPEDHNQSQGAYYAHWSDILITAMAASLIPYARVGESLVGSRITDMANIGMKLSAVCTDNTTATLESDYTATQSWFQVEGQNENPNCAAALTFQQGLYANVKASPILGPNGANLRVCGPGLVGGSCQTTNYGPDCDVGGYHTYIHGKHPEISGWMHSYLADAKLNYPGLPIVISELGYRQIAPGELAGQNSVPGVPADVRARYVVRWALFNMFLGTWCMSIFHQLAENRAVSATDSQYGYGLLDLNGAPTPAWTALCNLIALFNDPGSPFTPTPLDFTKGNADVMSMIFQKQNGHYLIPLWLGKPSWDDSTYTRLTVAPQNCVLTMPSISQARGNIFNAADGSLTPINQFATNGAPFTISVSDDLMVLEVW